MRILCLLLFSSCKQLYDLKLNDVSEPRNCLEYKSKNPAALDDDYELDLDGDPTTPLQKVYCDFSNGGWTRVIGMNTTLTDLSEFGDTSDLISFYSGAKGVGWGGTVVTGGENATPKIMECLVLSKIKKIKSVKTTLAWAGTVGSYGYLYMSNHIDPTSYTNGTEYYAILYEDPGSLFALDAWTGEVRNRVGISKIGTPENQTTYYGQQTPTLETDYISNGNYEICMGGEDSNYDKRYIQEFSFK